jgi:uncharacterized delta-60 repeat protein
LAVDAAGRVVAAGALTQPEPGCQPYSSGFCQTALVVARFTASGLDATFGTSGVAAVDLATDEDDSAYAVLVQPDGRVVVTGETRTSGSSTVLVVARFETSGQLDATFGTGGVSKPADFYSSFFRGTALGLTPDGRIVIGATSGRDAFVTRVLPNGTLDGSWQSPVLFGVSVTDLHVRDDGRVVVGMGGWAMFVTRLLANGTEDRVFLGPTRAALLAQFHPYDPDYGRETLGTMLVRPDGRILVAGSTVWRVGDPSPQNFHSAIAVAQFHQDMPAAPPTSVTATAGNGSASVTWSAPEDTGGLPLDGFAVRVEPGGTDVSLPASARSFAVSGLVNGAAYRFHVRATTALGPGVTATSAAVTPSAPPPPPPPPPPPAPSPHRQGYWMVGRSGDTYAFGQAGYFGGGPALSPFVDLEPTPSGNGYWRITERGDVYTSGDAAYFGGAPPLARGERVTSLSRTRTGDGYWIFTSAGRAFNRGGARHLGDMAGITLNGEVLDSIPTPSGDGYYMVASDGGIFTFGDAAFRGSMGDVRLNAPVQSLVPDPDGSGYWLVASDGGIFAFDAAFYGSMGSTPLNRPVTGMVGFAGGYLMVAEDGGIFTFGDAPFFGSLGASPPGQPIVSVAVLDQP